jgi:hypothetical protein
MTHFMTSAVSPSPGSSASPASAEEVLAAYVVTEPGSDLSAADVSAALRARLAACTIPRMIKFAGTLDTIG